MAKQFYDYKTSNQSFLDMHKYLKRKGIKNNNFMLLLNNKNLVGVDPYDPNLTLSQKMDIIKECSTNIWYFLREVARYPVIGESNMPFVLDLTNMAQIHCTLSSIPSWVTKSRQLRKTTDSAQVVNYARIFSGILDEVPFQRIRILSKNRNNARDIQLRMKKITECLPGYIQRIDINKFSCVNADTPMGTVKSIEKAQSVAKSFFDSIIYFTDAEFIDYIKYIYDAAIGPYHSASLAARSKGLMSAMMFESTISDDTTADVLLDNNSMMWNDKFYDMTENELKNHLKENNLGIIHIFYTYQDLGLDENWFVYQCKLLGDNIDPIRREILCKRKNKE